MKLYFSIAIVVAALTGCGEKDEPKIEQGEMPMVIPDEFSKIWWTGVMPAGKTEPESVDCIANGPHGFRREHMVGKYVFGEGDEGMLFGVQYLNSPDCSSTDMWLTEGQYAGYRELSIVKGRMEVLPIRYEYRVEVKTDKTAELLNRERICGHSDWKKGSYKEGAKELESCEPANVKGLLFKSPSEIRDFKESIYQFKLLGKKGLEISRKKPGGDKFESPLYFVKLGKDR